MGGLESASPPATMDCCDGWAGYESLLCIEEYIPWVARCADRIASIESVLAADGFLEGFTSVIFPSTTWMEGLCILSSFRSVWRCEEKMDVKGVESCEALLEDFLNTRTHLRRRT